LSFWQAYTLRVALLVKQDKVSVKAIYLAPEMPDQFGARYQEAWTTVVLS